MTDIERITDMEQCFDRVDRALRALEEAVNSILSVGVVIHPVIHLGCMMS